VVLYFLQYIEMLQPNQKIARNAVWGIIFSISN
jgi:hypothetical protein